MWRIVLQNATPPLTPLEIPMQARYISLNALVFFKKNLALPPQEIAIHSVKGVWVFYATALPIGIMGNDS